MPSTLITGANRGLGFEFARQYSADGWQVYAACRNPQSASELRRLGDASMCPAGSSWPSTATTQITIRPSTISAPVEVQRRRRALSLTRNRGVSQNLFTLANTSMIRSSPTLVRTRFPYSVPKRCRIPSVMYQVLTMPLPRPICLLRAGEAHQRQRNRNQ